MSQLIPADAVTTDAAQLQSELRRRLLAELFTSVHSAPTLIAAIDALGAHHPALEALGLHDEAARLRAFTKAVRADVVRIDQEAAELTARARVSPAAQ